MYSESWNVQRSSTDAGIGSTILPSEKVMDDRYVMSLSSS